MASHEDLLHCLVRLDAEENSILCMHAGVDGAAVGTLEYRIKDPLTVEDLGAERFNWVFLGHYHKPQTIGDNVVYVGSPCQLTRAEAGDVKRFLIYDTESGKVSSVRTRCKEFHTVAWPKCKRMDLCEGYYDVVVSDNSTPEDVRAFFGEKGITSVKIITPPKADNTEARIEVDETTSDLDLIQQYCKHKDKPKAADVGTYILGQLTGAVASNLRIKFLEVRAKNFLSLSRATLRLNQPGSVIAVLGENQDAEGFKSNGSGKSSLLPESLFWCLFGETARNLPADKVVNNIRKRGCLVAVTLKVDNQLVVITRTRKHKELGTGLYLSIDNKDMTQGTVAQTQTYLEQILGMDYTTFSSVVAFSPETIRFVNSKDSEQKAVLDSILQTQRFGEALKLTKARVTELNAKAKGQSDSITFGKSKLEGLHDTLSVLAADIKTEKQRKREWAQHEQETIAELTAAAKTLKKDIKAAEEELAMVSSTVQPLIDVEELSDNLMTVGNLLAGVSATLSSYKRELNNIQAELDKIDTREGRPCPSCGQIVQSLAKMKVSFANQLRVKHAEVEDYKERERKAIIAKSEAQATLNKAQIHNKQEQDKKARADGIRLKLAGLRETLTGTEAEIITRPPYDDRMLKLFTQRHEAHQTSIQELQTQVNAWEEDLEATNYMLGLYQFWVEGFGNKGLKSFLLDNILPHLTQYAQQFADELTGNSIKIQFSTVSETGIDRFGVSAFNSEGSDIYAGNSSGEKRRIDMAVMFALFMLANSRVKLNLMMLDECLDTLDAAGIDTVVSILEDIAKKRKLTIFVTSHTELADRLHESITVVKRNGLSELKD
jgi:DNA repair exonuclease SbcCD ATPase subunit